MMASFFLKLGMLAVTAALVWWLRWMPSETAHSSQSVAEQPATVSLNHGVIKEGQQVSQRPAKTLVQPHVDQMPQQTTHREAMYELLDLNRANLNELESLPGVGPVLAQRVIAFRNSSGGFRQIDELREVKGIGAKKFERLKSLVMVAPPAAQHMAKRSEL